MPRPQRPAPESAKPTAAKRCTAHTTSGSRCKRAVVPGLTVCKSHGGATAASVRAGQRASVSQQAAQLWGIGSDTSSDLSVEQELRKLVKNKLTDVLALRLKIGGDSVGKHIGMLTETVVDVEYDIIGTVQSKNGTQSTRSRRSGTSVWVQELHRTEQELMQALRLLHEVTGGTEVVDTKRLKMQTARQAARILKAYPGISIDDVAAEVAKSA